MDDLQGCLLDTASDIVLTCVCCSWMPLCPNGGASMSFVIPSAVGNESCVQTKFLSRRWSGTQSELDLKPTIF